MIPLVVVVRHKLPHRLLKSNDLITSPAFVVIKAANEFKAMFKEVRKSVVEKTKGQQTPWESSSLLGDFYFKISK